MELAVRLPDVFVGLICAGAPIVLMNQAGAGGAK
jgi:hypothetical protein